MTTTVTQYQADFPILGRQIHGHRLVYLDSAATSQKPRAVLDAEFEYYRHSNANILRSVHTLAEESTEAYEATRREVARFIGAPRPEEVIFTRGTTESLNLVARGWGDAHLEAGDVVVVTLLEHHSNLIPWQQLVRRKGAELRYIELNADGTLSMESAERAIDERTKVVAVTQTSNVLGTIPPIATLAELAHRVGAILVVDGAQSVPHQLIDVVRLGADFLAFSGHKMYGPTGVGVLWGRMNHLESMDPVLYGGEMIGLVERDHATWADIPQRFEGGTPNIAGVVGLRSAIHYLEQVGLTTVETHERALAEMAYHRLQNMPGVTVYGPSRDRGALVAFNVDGIHPHDLAQALDAEGVAIRAGHHCAQPLMQWLGVTATARASFGLYNDENDVEALETAIHRAQRYFQR